MNFEDFINDKNIEMNHVELCNLINKLRKDEGNRKELRQRDLITKIRKELETLKSLDLEGVRNFSQSYFEDSQGKKHETYIMNKDGILLIASKESTYVRAKIIEYINTLETYIEETGQSEEFKYYRRTGKIIRRGLTDTIKNVYGNTDKFIYAKYTNLVYNIVFDKSASEIRLGKGLKKNQALRDNFTSEELDKILEVENKLKSLIETYDMEGVCLDLIYERAKGTILRVYHKIAI